MSVLFCQYSVRATTKEQAQTSSPLFKQRLRNQELPL
jgi:hypothetical protein